MSNHITWHDQSERTNQTIEITLRYLLTKNSNLSWHEELSFLQQRYMNIITSTEFSLNQILYEFNTIWKLSALNENIEIEFFKNREIIRIDVVNVIDCVSAKAKIIYDSHHKLLTFNTEDKVYLRLHHEYSLFEKRNSKLSNQRSDSYIILRKINSLAYKLNLSATSRIHSVIFIAQLKSTSNSDLYKRSQSINLESIEMKDDIVDKKSYEIERILKKRNRKYEKITMIHYLVKWKRWKLEHNFWVFAKNCENFMNLIMSIH
jgi:hypothetical protein